MTPRDRPRMPTSFPDKRGLTIDAIVPDLAASAKSTLAYAASTPYFVSVAVRLSGGGGTDRLNELLQFVLAASHDKNVPLAAREF
jgi:hypothetical protein